MDPDQSRRSARACRTRPTRDWGSAGDCPEDRCNNRGLGGMACTRTPYTAMRTPYRAMRTLYMGTRTVYEGTGKGLALEPGPEIRQRQRWTRLRAVSS